MCTVVFDFNYGPRRSSGYKLPPHSTERTLSLSGSTLDALLVILAGLYVRFSKMNYRKNAPTDRVCDHCGVLGHARDLAICSQCKRISRHIYCMPVQLYDLPREWYCEECLASAQGTHKKQKILGLSHADNKNTEIPIKGSALLNKNGSCRQASCSRVSVAGFSSGVHMTKPISRTSSLRMPKSIPPKNSKVKFLPEAALLESGKIVSASATRKISGPLVSQTQQAQTSHCTPSSKEVKSVKESITEEPRKRCAVSDSNFLPNAAKRVEAVTNVLSSRKTRSDNEIQKVKGKQTLMVSVNEEPVRCSPRSNKTVPIKSRFGFNANSHTGEQEHNLENKKAIVKTARSDTPLKSTGFRTMDQPSELFVTSDELHTSWPQPKSSWRGEFEVSDVVPHTYAIRAHIPGKLCLKAYDAIRKFPEQLKFELLPRVDVWPRIFKQDPPTSEDVGVYFFHFKEERYKEEYISLLDKMDNGDLVMQSCLEDADLLVFTSKQLLQNSLGPARTFLWGVFRKVKRMARNQSIHSKVKS